MSTLSPLMLYICTTANVHKKWTSHFIHSNYLPLVKQLLFFLYFIVILYLTLYVYTLSSTLSHTLSLYFVLSLSYQMLYIHTTVNVLKSGGITIHPLQLSKTW